MLKKFAAVGRRKSYSTEEEPTAAEKAIEAPATIAEKPAEKPVEKPLEQPAEKPAEKVGPMGPMTAVKETKLPSLGIGFGASVNAEIKKKNVEKKDGDEKETKTEPETKAGEKSELPSLGIGFGASVVAEIKKKNVEKKDGDEKKTKTEPETKAEEKSDEAAVHPQAKPRPVGVKPGPRALPADLKQVQERKVRRNQLALLYY